MTNVTVLPEAFLKPVIGQPPEQSHPGQINFTDFGSNPSLKRASETLGFGWETASAIRELRANPHPEDRPATHARKVRETIDRFDREWAQRWDGAKAQLKGEQQRIESQLASAANLRPVLHHFDAITSSFHGMKPDQRQDTLGALIEQGDGATLATLIDAPLFLTGLTADQRETIKLRLYSKVDPTGMALRGQLEKALAKMEAASIAIINDRQVLREGTTGFDKRARDAEALATKARSGFVS